MKLYLDTSVISHLFADDSPQEMVTTRKLWEQIKNGEGEIFISETVQDELLKCAEPKRTKMFDALDEIEYKVLTETQEVHTLAKTYLNNNVLSIKSKIDCYHIANAVVGNCDFIISWNFKHLVNVKTINSVKVVNTINNYREIGIISPKMLIIEED